jgi:hypothetical protein
MRDGHLSVTRQGRESRRKDAAVPDAIVALVFFIPIIAIVGGIFSGIVRTISRHRLLELAQRERIAAIERGVDPSKISPSPFDLREGTPVSRYDSALQWSQGLFVGGVIIMAAGLGLAIFLRLMEPDKNVWAVSLMPILVGTALLLCSWFVRPRDSGRNPGSDLPRP